MKIYLVRHGEAVTPEIDPEKPLSPQGRNEVAAIARFLGKNSFPLSCILHSDKLRAKQTAEIMGEYLAPEAALELHQSLAPNDPIGPVFERISLQNEDAMIVGHLPFLVKLASYMLVDTVDREIIKFGLGTTACLESQNGSFVINWIVGSDITSLINH